MSRALLMVTLLAMAICGLVMGQMVVAADTTPGAASGTAVEKPAAPADGAAKEKPARKAGGAGAALKKNVEDAAAAVDAAKKAVEEGKKDEALTQLKKAADLLADVQKAMTPKKADGEAKKPAEGEKKTGDATK